MLAGFTATFYDSDTSNYYARARYLNPATGRFISRDPAAINFGTPVELMRYGYVGGDQVSEAHTSIGWIRTHKMGCG